jgi:hypothetical protein
MLTGLYSRLALCAMRSGFENPQEARAASRKTSWKPFLKTNSLEDDCALSSSNDD